MFFKKKTSQTKMVSDAMFDKTKSDLISGVVCSLCENVLWFCTENDHINSDDGSARVSVFTSGLFNRGNMDSYS